MLAPPVDDLVHALKYEGWPELADLMGRELSRVGLPEADRSSVVVPVPTTAERRRRRGYNQAELLAESFARHAGRSVRRALERRAEGRSQTTLSPAERRENVRGVFAPAPSGGVAGERVLLVDDVLTTGSTAAEAATTLRGMGAAHVTLVAFARALP